MKTDGPIFVHVGYPRTATTFLQRILFPNLPVFYLNKPDSLKEYTRTGLESHAVTFRGLIKAAYLPVFISDEGLIADNAQYQLWNLQSICPNAELIFTIRSQYDQIISRYCQMVKRGQEHRKIREYFTGRVKYYTIGFVSYACMLEHAQSLFPKVHVFVYEKYIKNLAMMVHDLGEIIGGLTKEKEDSIIRTVEAHFDPTNQSMFSMLHWLRHLNRIQHIRNSAVGRVLFEFISKRGLKIDSVKPNDIRDRKRKFILESTRDIFNEQNRRLEKLIGTKLPQNYFR